MYLTGFGELESDIVVVANVIQAFGLFCQLVVTLDIILTFPSAVQCYFQHVVLVSFQFEFECVFLRLDGSGVPSVGFVEPGIHDQCAVTCDVELRWSGGSRYIFLRCVPLTIAVVWFVLIPCQVGSLVITSVVEYDFIVVLRE